MKNAGENTITDLSCWYEVCRGDHFWFDWRFQALAKQLTRLGINLTGQHLLEVGCGASVLRCQIEEGLGAVVDGTELNLKAEHYTSYRGKGQVTNYDILECHTAQLEKYDGVVLFDFLEHVADPVHYLSAAKAHVRSGGYCLINVPARHELYSEYDRAAGHVKRYSKEELTSELCASGWKLLHTQYWGLGLYPIALLRKIWLTFGKRTDQENILAGYLPPNPCVNTLLRILGRIETSVLSHPPLGMAILAVARKI